MQLSPSKVNWFLFFKLPAAYWCGVRLVQLDHHESKASVKYRWFNQNPFRSMYFAVQMMAAELTTGALALSAIRESGKSVSMLVASSQSVYHKKITGRVTFSCRQGQLVRETLAAAIASGAPQTVRLHAIGRNESNEVVSEMTFEWTLKVR
ncbi:Acyl-coenzyme A thioesterase PaaI, contains HGG motif [Flavobacterium longum]|uniref:DUF4442 domain-containing protein n=1 Tax=Flavobacterium longum TaxID=1299340 RepID=UPI0039E85451